MGLLKSAILGGAMALLIHILHMLDVNKVVYPHEPGFCRPLENLKDGSEDIILLKSGIAIISSGLHVPGQPEAVGPGRMYAFNMNPSQGSAPSSQLRELQVVGHPAREDFHPLGMSVWESGSKVTLFVVNNPSATVDVFDVDMASSKLTYRKTISDPLFRSPNNLVATGPDQFYITNFLHSQNRWLQQIELAFQLPLGSVVHYDNGKARQLLTWLKGPNGLALSQDGKYVYLALNFAEKLQIYQITADKGLTLKDEIELFTGIDNLNVDLQGNIWTGAHPVMYRIAGHAMNRKKFSAPSQVLRISIKTGPGGSPKIGEVTEVYVDDGLKLSGSSVAVKLGDKLLIGTILNRAMLCTLDRSYE